MNRMKLKKITNSPRVLLYMFFTRLGHFVYSYASRLDKDAEAIFLNYGYADDNLKLELRKEDDKNRYCIQLYNHIVASLPVELKGLDVLEVGSGRGGGASYVARYFKDDEIWGSGSRNGRLMRITADMSLKEVLSYIDDEIDVTSKQYIDCAKKTEIVSAKLWRNRALSQFVAAVEMSKKRK